MSGLGVNTRVLMIGAHPDDEDTFLIAWLSRGRHVETAYLSLTRGDGGQNLIGNELGEALGVIRTEELLAARRVDGARQYFTRAYDFGYSKDTVDTYKHWPKDSILADVVRVVRAFRPHVIVAVFSGTTRDGHGQHQVSGLLAREAYDVAGDTARFSIARHGRPWAPMKFYRSARFNAAAGTLTFDAGEYSPLLGRSYAEIAGESRSQHKSQGFGALQRRGPVLGYLRREGTRVNETTAAASEGSLFDGIDTTWNRFRSVLEKDQSRRAIDSLPRALRAVADSFDAFAPRRTLGALKRLNRLADVLSLDRCPDGLCTGFVADGDGRQDPDFQASTTALKERVNDAIALASGIVVEVIAQRELHTEDAPLRYITTVYNRSADTIRIPGRAPVAGAGPPSIDRVVPPWGVARDSFVSGLTQTQPWWLVFGRRGAMFVSPRAAPVPEDRFHGTGVGYGFHLGAELSRDGPPTFSGHASVVHRTVDAVRGEVQREIAGVPAITVTLGQHIQYAQANTPINRTLDVQLRSADEKPRDVRVTLALPPGLSADSGARTVRLDGYDAQRTVSFHIRGRLRPGEHRIAATAESDGQTFATGYQLIDYDHIRRQRIYRPATTTISAVDVRVPATLRVAYIRGVGDNVAPALAQLGISVTVLAAADVARANLSSFTTVVVGPRAYEAHPELVAANPRLLEFARRGGTLVVQYGQFEMAQPGIMPFPITHARPADRVTEEDARVTIIDANARALRFPNRIGADDFLGWVQERALYMPRTFDDRYRALVAINDTGEQPNRGAILMAPYGAGVYIYTTLSLFRQLPAGVPGGARLLVNLLSAGIGAPAATR